MFKPCLLGYTVQIKSCFEGETMTKTSKRTKFKTQRRLKTELPGLGRPGALSQKDTQRFHGRRLSDYGVRLQEKQKICFH